MANRKSPTDAEILARVPPAKERAAREEREGMHARAASYDADSERIVLELTNGYMLAVPRAALPKLAKAKPSQLADVEVSPGGSVITFADLDADYSVPALVLGAMQKREARRELARMAGSVRSVAKAKAARVNGQKGGRPRKFAFGKAEKGGHRFIRVDKDGSIHPIRPAAVATSKASGKPSGTRTQG